MVTKELLNMVFAEAADNVNPSGFRSTSWPRTRMRRKLMQSFTNCRILSAVRSLKIVQLRCDFCSRCYDIVKGD